MTTSRVAAVLLAAGASRRLGAPKQLLRDHDGTYLIARLADAALAAGFAPVIVVLGANAAETREALATRDVRCVENATWSDGMASSIRAGVVAAGNVDALLLLACDQPAVHTAHLRALHDAWQAHGARVVSTYDGVHGIPAIWPRADFADLRALTGDRGAKGLLRGDEHAVPVAGGALDLDAPADVVRWRALEASPGAGTPDDHGD